MWRHSSTATFLLTLQTSLISVFHISFWTFITHTTVGKHETRKALHLYLYFGICNENLCSPSKHGRQYKQRNFLIIFLYFCMYVYLNFNNFYVFIIIKCYAKCYYYYYHYILLLLLLLLLLFKPTSTTPQTWKLINSILV